MTGPQIVSGDHDKAAAHYDAMLREIESLRAQLAEAREQRDQAAEALVRAETAIQALRRERDDALQEAESVGRQLHSSTREVDRLIAQLATVTEERDRWQQLAEERAKNLHATLRRAFAAEDLVLVLRAERDGARAEIARLHRAVLAVAEDLERYASDPEGLPMSERKLAWTLRQIVERPEAPESPAGAS